MKIGILHIQCSDNKGRVSDFIRDSNGVQLSPSFDGLVELFSWLRSNNWKPLQYNPKYPTGEYAKID